MATARPLLSLLLLSLVLSGTSPCSEQSPSPTVSPLPSPRPDAAELATLPADTLATWVVDLTWLVETLRADLRVAEVYRASQVDSLRRRLEYAEERLRWAEEDRPSWWETWGLPIGAAALAGLSVWVGATAAD